MTKRIPNSERKLRAVGIMKWEGRQSAKVLRKALGIITKQLQNPNVGLYRRECLLKLRVEFQNYVNPTNRIVVLRGGLPSLGRRI